MEARLVLGSRTVLTLVAAFVIALLSGCSEPAEPSGDLRGKVYSNGEVVGDCLAYVYSKTSKRTIGGKVNDEGEFEFLGLPLGECRVAVSQNTSSDPKGPPFDKRIPRKFRVTKTSGFVIDIKEGDNELDLKMEF